MTKILVLTCIDPRYTEVLAKYLIHQANVHASYDLVVLAGSSLGVLATTTGGSNPLLPGSWPQKVTWPIISSGANSLCTCDWSAMFNDHVRIAIALHDISEIWVFDHMDCGAYKAFMLGTSGDQGDIDRAPHYTNLDAMVNYINATWNTPTKVLEVKTFLMDLPKNGYTISMHSSTGGIEISEPLSPLILVLVLGLAVLFILR